MTPPIGVRRVAIIGNPNTGKSSVFNALTGLSQKVGNYPGVTVEKRIGVLAPEIELVDLPGTYSLAAHSPDEMLAVNVLLGDHAGETRPDLVVVIADANNLQRNLYLVTQIIEVGLPTIVALNMIDVADRHGISINTRGLSKTLNVPVVPTVANRRLGIEELRTAILSSLDVTPPTPAWNWPEPIAKELEYLENRFGGDRFLLGRALIDEGGAAEKLLSTLHDGDLTTALAESRGRIRREGFPPTVFEANMRHDWIMGATSPYVQQAPRRGKRRTEQIDDLVIHRVFGIPIFLIIMATVFISIFTWANPFMAIITKWFNRLGEMMILLFQGTALEGGALESLLVDGVIAGVGGVLVFLPQIVFLFIFIAILEDCGYMARAAFLMDRLFRSCGLSGTSIIPLLSSFACAVPGILATRTISDPRDRLTTILVAPFMSCSARIPVYALMIAAFIPPIMVGGFLPLQGLIFGAMYLVGILVAIPVAIFFKRALLRGPKSTFVMELPSYKVPSIRSVATRIYDRARTFLRLAGTIIVAMSIIVWALGYFPRPASIGQKYAGLRTEAEQTLAGDELEGRLNGLEKLEVSEYLLNSFLGRAGKILEPVVRPLGWDWKIGMATLASFPAREVIVSTLQVIYDLGERPRSQDNEKTLIARLTRAEKPDGSKAITLPVALSIMVFFALCCQCGATLATIMRETNSWKWPAVTFGYMTLLAYIGALITYQVGSVFLS